MTTNGGTMQVGNGYVGAFSNSANSVALNVGGGTYVQLATTRDQQPGVQLGIGCEPRRFDGDRERHNNAGTLLNFAAAGSRAVGGTVNFNLPTNLGGAQTAANGITTAQLNTNGILGGYATVGGNDWATKRNQPFGRQHHRALASSITGTARIHTAPLLNTNVVAGGVGAHDQQFAVQHHRGEYRYSCRDQFAHFRRHPGHKQCRQ